MIKKKFQIKSIKDIPFEKIHDVSKSRKTLVTKEDLVTDNIDAMTKGFLESNQKWDWHKHDEHDEMGIVLKGEGKFFWEDKIVNYKPDDLIIIPANSNHKFEATGNIINEFYFVGIKV